jgi:hypothetical protein
VRVKFWVGGMVEVGSEPVAFAVVIVGRFDWRWDCGVV